VDGETIPLGPVHWAKGLQATVLHHPYQPATEASTMGGVWQDNFDDTFTQLDDYYVPATGRSCPISLFAPQVFLCFCADLMTAAKSSPP
jgi:hypothetical protein